MPVACIANPPTAEVASSFEAGVLCGWLPRPWAAHLVPLVARSLESGREGGGDGRAVSAWLAGVRHSTTDAHVVECLRAELVRARRRARLEAALGAPVCAGLSQEAVDVLVREDPALARRVLERPPAGGAFTRRLVLRRLEEARRAR